MALRPHKAPDQSVSEKSTPWHSLSLSCAGALDCLQKSVKAEGASCLFKGASANYARMVPYTILLFVFFEQYKKVYELALAPRAHGRHETGKV